MSHLEKYTALADPKMLFAFTKAQNRSVADMALELGLKRYHNVFCQLNLELLNSESMVNQTLELFEDESSKQAYGQGLLDFSVRKCTYNSLTALNPLKAAHKYLPLLYQWDELLNTSDKPKFDAHKYDQPFLKAMLMSNFIEHKYRYQDIFTVESSDVVIDCGAGFGTSTVWFYKEGASKVYSFEPSASNFELLKLNLQANHYATDLTYNLALGESNETTLFYSGTGLGGEGRLVTSKNQDKLINLREDFDNFEQKYLKEVQQMRLDDWCAEQQIAPTLLKIDVVDSELDVLKGASALIQQNRPKIAVCINSQLSNMWEVPTFLKSLVPQYKLYCKSCQHMTDQFVLFAKD